jgi:putative ABC transport system permease protein
MSRIRGLRRYFRLPPMESTVERDVAEELAFHLETRVDELVARGMDEHGARAQAAREFGDLAAARAEITALDRQTLRRSRRAGVLDALQWDVRYALRMLRRQPGLTFSVVVTLGLGMGANAAMFGITDRLLLRAPPHVVDADRVQRVFFRQTFSWAGQVTQPSTGYADYASMRDELSGVASVAAWFPTRASLGRGQEAQEVRRVIATPSFFTTLGVRPLLGRFYTDEETDAGVVLSHGFWQRHFGGDAGVLGRTLRIGNATYTVVGVAPRGFTGADLDPVDVWVPFAVAGEEIAGDTWASMSSHNIRWVRTLVRLRPDADVVAVEAHATALQSSLNPEGFGRDSTARVVLGPVVAARGPAVGAGMEQRSARIALWLSGVSAMVLLIACANVANLLLARAMRRRREISVRLALGVGRGRLAAQMLVETLLLAVAGGALGLLLAHWGGAAARALLLPDVTWESSPVDARVLVVTAALVLLSTLLAGLAPVAHALRGNLAQTFRGGTRAGTYDRSRLRTLLLAAQATLCVVLLVGAGLFVRSLHNVRGLDMGFDADRVIVLHWDASAIALSRAERELLYERAHERVRQLPQIADAAVAMTIPFWSSISAALHVPGVDSIPVPADGGPYYNAVTPEYFRTTGTRIVRGRTFTDRDVEGSGRVAIVSETMARTLWPGEDALGRCIHVGGRDEPCSEVIGIAQDARRQTIEGGPVLQYYLPLAQRQTDASLRALFIRVQRNTATSMLPIHQAVQSLAPDLPHAQLQLLQDLVDPQIRPWRLGATMFSVFGLLAVVLAAIGLYGVIAYDIAQRRQEIGVRVALGAGMRQVVTLVLAAAARVIVIGVPLGLLAALLAGSSLEPLLFQVSARDPATLAAVSLLLVVISFAAALVPARRALRIDPATALREE